LKILCMKSERDQPFWFEDDRTLSVRGAKNLGRGILLHCFEMLFDEEGVFENLVQHRSGLLQVPPCLSGDMSPIREIVGDGSYRSGACLARMTFQRQ